MLKSIYENYLKHYVILIPESLQKKCFVVKTEFYTEMFPYFGYPEPSSIGCCKEFNLNSTVTNRHNGLFKVCGYLFVKRNLTAVFFSLHCYLPTPHLCTAHSGAAWLYYELLNGGHRSAASKATSIGFPKPLSKSHPSKVQHRPTAHSQVGNATEQLP